jgi:hypothetical protein
MRAMVSMRSSGRVSFLLITTAAVAIATACSSSGSSPGGGNGSGGSAPGAGGIPGNVGGGVGNLGGAVAGLGGAVAGLGGAVAGLGGAVTGAGGVPPTNDCSGQETSATGADPLVDDLETLAEDGTPGGDNATPEVDGRLGYWYTYNDATPGAVQEPVGDFVPTADGYNSTYAACTSGADFAEWGAGLGVNFNTVGDIGCPYNASVYTGIHFCVKGSGTASVRIPIAATVPIAEGGSCADNCYDHFAISVPLTADWVCQDVHWADLSQGNWGTAATFDPATLISFQVQFAQNTTFEFCIDELTFLTT